MSNSQANEIPSITDAEWVLMLEIWDRNQATARDLVKALEGTQSWKPNTIKTLLRRLSDKGVIGYEKSGREHIYRPLVKREQAEQAHSHTFIQRVVEGRTAPFLKGILENKTSTGDQATNPPMNHSANLTEPPYSESDNADSEAPPSRQAKIVGFNREAFDPNDLGELAWNWNSAQRAAEPHARQWKDAMSFLDPIIKKHPEFLSARKLMRTAELNAELKIPLSDRIPPPQSYIKKAQKKIEAGHPEEAIEMLEEKVFVYLPTNAKANIALHEAAIAAGLPETALFALKFAAEMNDADKEIHQKLGEHYEAREEFENACAALKRVMEIDPSDPEADRSYRNMIAQASMHGGKIEEKDHQGRIESEQLEKQAVTDDQKRLEIANLLEAFEKVRSITAPETNEPYKIAREGLKKASRYAWELGQDHLPDLEQALELQHLLVEAFPDDPALLSGLDELGVAVMEKKLQVAEEEFQECQSSAERGLKEISLNELRSQVASTALEVAERAAHANPTNGKAQLNLGKALIGAGKFREAVKPLQRAKKDPRSGNDIEAMSLLADCFLEGNLTNLAQGELEAAITKIDKKGDEQADLQWKDLVYKLALLHEGCGNESQASELFSQIYARDSDYKDVENRVWGG